jgi:hypothetical protein
LAGALCGIHFVLPFCIAQPIFPWLALSVALILSCHSIPHNPSSLGWP